MGKTLVSTVGGSDHHNQHIKNVSNFHNSNPPSDAGAKDLGKHGYYDSKAGSAGTQVNTWSVTDNPMPDVKSNYKKAVPMPDVSSGNEPIKKQKPRLI